VNEYGAVTKSNTEKFHTDNFDNPVPAWIGGHVYNSIQNNPISNAIMRVLSVTGNTLNNFTTDASGSYVAEISEDAHTISVEASPYNPRNWTVPWRRSYRSNDYREEELMIMDFGLEGPGKAADPQFSPFPELYFKDQKIALSCPTVDAKIYYTTDGSEDWTEYSADSPIILNEAMTIKAYADRDGIEKSDIVRGDYEVTTQAFSPRFPLPVGAYVAGSKVELSHDERMPDAMIYYTTDGSEPNENSRPYSEPIVLDEPMTIKAVAYMDGLETSEVVTGEYCRRLQG